MVSKETQTSAGDTVIDGVQRLPPSGISILIVGGGIGGLALACEGWRQGHDMHVVEKNPNNVPVGDSFNIGPSALTTMRFFPSLHKEFESNDIDALFGFSTNSGQPICSFDEPPWNNPGVTHPALGVHVAWLQPRLKVYHALQAQARRLGITIDYNKDVVEYHEDEKHGIARTDAGEVFRGDLVVAADGVGTKSHKHVTGVPARAISSGMAVFRGKVPTERLRHISQDARTKYLSGSRPVMRSWPMKKGGLHPS